VRKGVQRRQRAGGRDLEQRAAAVDAAAVGYAIELAVAGLDQGGQGKGAVGIGFAAAGGAEVIDDV